MALAGIGSAADEVGVPSIRELRSFQRTLRGLQAQGELALASFWDESNGTYGKPELDGGFRISYSCFVLLYRSACGGHGTASDSPENVIKQRLESMDLLVTSEDLPEYNVYSSGIMCATCREVGINLDTNVKRSNSLNALRAELDDASHPGVRRR